MADGADFDLVGFDVSNGSQIEAGPNIGLNMSVSSTDNTNGAGGVSITFSTNVTVTSLGPTDGASVSLSAFSIWGVDSTGSFLDGAPDIPLQIGQSVGFNVTSTGITESGGVVTLSAFSVTATGNGQELIDISTAWNVSGTANATIAGDVDIMFPWTVAAVGLAGNSMDVDIDFSGGFNVSALGVNNTDITLNTLAVSGSLLSGLISNAGVIVSGFGVDAVGSSVITATTDIGISFGVSGSLLSQNIGSVSVTVDSIYAQATGLTGSVGRAAATIILTSDASGYSAITYSSDITLTASVDAVGVEVLGNTGFKVIAMNPEVGGDTVTEFTNYDFNSYACFNGVYYGASSTGLFDISGATDSGSPIAGRALLGITDFASETQMYVPYAYLTYRTDGDLEILTRTNEEIDRVNECQWDGTEGIHEKRVPLNPGVKSRQWQFGLQNVDGADFEIAVMRPLPMPTDRRI